MATTATEREVLHLEKRFWDAMKQDDYATMESLCADPCLVAGAEGVTLVPRSQFRQMMESGDFRLRSFSLDEQNASVRPIADGAVAVAYKVHEEYDQSGKRQQIDAYDTSIWVREGGQWRCAVHTETPATAARS